MQQLERAAAVVGDKELAGEWLRTCSVTLATAADY